MPKTLIAVVSARPRQSTWAKAIRSTWLPWATSLADVKFFVGRGTGEVLLDTVALECEDSYHGLPNKVQEIVRYALSHGYEYVFKCDDDVVIKPKEVLSSGFNKHSYTGRNGRAPTKREPYWIPNGFLYALSKSSMEVISNSSLPSNGDDERWVAECLYRAGIHLHGEPRYHLQYTVTADKQKIRTNRPLRFGKAMQDPLRIEAGIAWCVALESGGTVPQVISTDTKIKEFYSLYRRYAEPSIAA